MDLVSQRRVQWKNVNGLEIKETAKSSEQIFGDLICQLLGEIPDGKIKDLASIEVQQILVKAKDQTKSRKMQNALYTNSFNVTPTYALVPPSRSYPSSIQSPTFNYYNFSYSISVFLKGFLKQKCFSSMSI